MEYGYVAVWLVTYLALGLAALPVVGRLFGGFRDRGAALSVPFALATLGLVGFLVGHLPGAFGLPAALAGLAVLAFVSYRASDGPADLRRAAVPAAVFALAFLFVVALRALDPAVTPIGGEKFLDFGLLKSLLRADALPPEDMWFAGESVRYYYGGHVLAALLAELTFTPARYAYNLALAGFYAAVVTAAYGIAATVAADHGVSGRVAGALGAFFVALAANLYTAGQLLVWTLPDALARPVVAALGLPVEEALAWTPGDFYYWPASRVIEGTINEFPLFAWLNGDLHAHMMSTNFLLLGVALLYAYWRTPEAEVGRRRLLVFGLLPPLGGYVATVNTWSFPSVTLGLAFLTLTFAPADPRTLLPARLRAALPSVEAAPEGAETDGGTVTAGTLLRTELARSGTALALAAGVLLLAVVWVAPFWFSTASGRPIGLFPPGASLGGLVVVHGGFLAAFVAYLVAVGREAAPAVRTAALAGTVALLLAGLGLGANAVALVGPVLLAAWLLLRAREDVGFETMLVVAGAGIVLLVEYVYVAEPQYAGTGLDRMNTVFKTYAQVWVLWAPAAGVALTRLAAAGRDAAPSFGSARVGTAGRVLVAVLLLTTGVYAALAVPAHVDAGSATANELGPTLDATAFVDVTHPAEAPAIDYIDALEGRPTIVTAAPAGYRWNPSGGDGASAPASLTGVPTVAGWFHERQYRSPEAYGTRVADVETIYTGTPAEQRALLDEYDVEYVYVGPAERARYGEITIGDLPGLRVVERGGVTIYVAESAG
ncbi:DUF2298 domain-containing protein [Halosegnis marinus]|uniref:DUF2298 domain-containing protein n=1 Tax=Halosegnis marinus TaxID=3034023 RepID=A0ABD5ZRB2_9EURY|nr:DUF2298 domain-containing protein [Halosegnis sp. DT85]